MTSCGETNEKSAALMHGAVSAMYLVMLIWHLMSTFRHWQRD